MGVMLDRPAWHGYASGSAVEHFRWWCELLLRQSVDRFAGEPLALEPWQMDFMGEALAVDEGGRPYWRTAVLIVPRKNGKTVMLSAYALYHLLMHDGLPEVLLTASSDKQAGRLFEAACMFVKRSPELDAQVFLREYVGQISRRDGLGSVNRMASEDTTLHGYNSSLVIADELHGWTTPKRRRAWGVINTSGGAREHTQVFSISTAGEAQDRGVSPLGVLLDRNESDGEIQRPHSGLTISRNERARTLVYNYSAPTQDPTDVEALKLANPASWITREYLAEQAASPELSPAQVLQLHGCVWANAHGVWFTAEEWAACQGELPRLPEPGTPVWVAVDVGLVRDCTAVGVAWVGPDRLVWHSSHVWAVDHAGQSPGVAHEHVSERMDLELVERHILWLRDQGLHVMNVTYDPMFFERSAAILSGEGLILVEMSQQGPAMYAALQRLYGDVREGRLRHPGDPVLTDHVLNTAAELTDRGWRVSKLKTNRHIDATVAMAMAHWMAANSLSPYEDRGLTLI